MPSSLLCPPDNVPPTLELTGATPLVAFALRGARTATVSAFPSMSATDPNGSPATLPADRITCNATIGGAGAAVTAATAFPYGVTVVMCVARDAAGNVGPAVSFAVNVACESGASVRAAGGVCEGELVAAACRVPVGVLLGERCDGVRSGPSPAL
jgi:hypothetical protein